MVTFHVPSCVCNSTAVCDSQCCISTNLGIRSSGMMGEGSSRCIAGEGEENKPCSHGNTTMGYC